HGNWPVTWSSHMRARLGCIFTISALPNLVRPQSCLSRHTITKPTSDGVDDPLTPRRTVGPCCGTDGSGCDTGVSSGRSEGSGIILIVGLQDPPYSSGDDPETQRWKS